MFNRAFVMAVAAVGWIVGGGAYTEAASYTYSDGETKAAPIIVTSDDGQSSTSDANFIVNAGSATQSGAVSYFAGGSYPNGPFVLTKSGAGSLTFTASVNVGGTPTTAGYFNVSSGNVTFAGGADMYYLSADGGNVTVTNGELATDATYIGTYGSSVLTLQVTGKLSNFTNFITLGYAAGSSGTLNFGAGSGQAPVAPGALVVSEVRARDGNGTVVFNHTSSDYSTSVQFTSIDTMRQEAGITTTIGNVEATNLVVTGGSFSNTSNLTGTNLTVAAGAMLRASNLNFASMSIAGKLGTGTETMLGQLALNRTTFGSGTTLELRVGGSEYYDGNTNTTLNDSVATVDTVDFAGTLRLVLEDGFRPALGDEIHLFDFYADHTGAFDQVVFNLPGYQGQMVYDTVEYSGFSYEIGLVRITAVPEPTSLMLLGMGGVVLLRRWRGNGSSRGV